MYLNRNPPARRLSHLRILDSKEARYTRAREVDVQDADGVAGQREGEGELCCYAGFADAAFAREHEDNVADVGERHQSGS